MPMYLIEENGQQLGFVSAISSSAAISAATKGRFKASVIKSAEEYDELLTKGLTKIVPAVEPVDPPAPEPEPVIKHTDDTADFAGDEALPESEDAEALANVND